MAIEIREVISKFVPSLIKESSPVLPTQPNVFSGLEGLLKRYGISSDSLDLNPKDRITRLKTPNGDLDIYWDKRTIVASLKNYLPQNLL